jgi:polysaccharide biosynthesis protein PslG
VVTAVLALGLLGAAAGVQAAPAPPSFFGVVPQTSLTTEDIDRMGQGKVGTLRFELFWAGVDPTSAAGDYDWSGPDAIVRDAARNGIRPLPFIYSTPTWVAEQLDGFNCGSQCAPFAPKSPAALEAWANFVRDAVRRYGPNGEFWTLNPTVPQLPIRAWQLLNEQNSPTFFKPKPKVKTYAKVLAAGHDAIVAEDPGAEIVLGGMFGTPLQGQKPAIAAWDYLEKLYKVKGAKKSFDGVAPHPYAAKFSKPGSQRSVLGQVELFRDEIKDARDRSASLWFTELGWASGGPPNPLNRGEAGQAKRLKEAFKFLKRKRGPWNIETVDWYSWRDNSAAGKALCEWCPKSGLFSESLEPKPSWDAFTRFTGGS